MKEILEQSRHSLEWLKFNQRQLDADGVEVAVSRQALDEVLIALETAIDVAPDVVAALKAALSAMDDARGNINPERGFADELEQDISDAADAVRAAIAKAEGRGDG